MNNREYSEKGDLRGEAALLRKKLGLDLTSPVDVFVLAGNVAENLTVVRYPFGATISGMCIKGDNNVVIAVNSTMSVGRQNFSMAHELFHMYCDVSSRQTVCPKVIGSGDPVERQADQFASYFLIPPDALFEAIRRETKNTGLTVENIVRLEQQFMVSRQAILYRLVQDRKITRQEAEPMEHHVIVSALELGYDDSLYRPLPTTEQHKSTGYYFRQARNLIEHELISSEKYRELMSGAFRSDIVFGEGSEGCDSFD